MDSPPFLHTGGPASSGRQQSSNTRTYLARGSDPSSTDPAFTLTRRLTFHPAHGVVDQFRSGLQVELLLDDASEAAGPQHALDVKRFVVHGNDEHGQSGHKCLNVFDEFQTIFPR